MEEGRITTKAGVSGSRGVGPVSRVAEHCFVLRSDFGAQKGEGVRVRGEKGGQGGGKGGQGGARGGGGAGGAERAQPELGEGRGGGLGGWFFANGIRGPAGLRISFWQAGFFAPMPKPPTQPLAWWSESLVMNS